ncbi:MAG: RNA polymerase sigma factor [Anaerolineae bacterium]|nr:RNA polymerase sigma factor [Anaerolineae bacterium]
MPGRSGQLTQAQALSSSSDLDQRFEALFRDLRQPVLNYLFRLLGDAEQAEDVSQDSFVKIYRALSGLPADANARAWVYRIATNAAYDALRRRRLIRWLPLLRQADEDDGYERREVGLPEAANEMAQLEQHLDVQAALNRLPTDLRTPLLLYSYQGLNTAEIAEIMQISRSAVKMRLQRARQLLGEHYTRESLIREEVQP